MLETEARINVDCVCFIGMKLVRVNLLNRKDKIHYSFIG